MKLFVYALTALFLLSCQDQAKEASAASQTNTDAPKNVILLIGDGMGLSQLSSAQYYGEGTPNLEQFPVVGLIKTSSSAQLITDSAAGATAFACGVKSYNGAIGVASDSTAVANLPELLLEKNMVSGVVATSTITHATPASFYAHQVSRNMHEAIAQDLANSNLNYFAGGGLKYFNKRSDSLNLLSELTAKGFQLDTAKIPTTLAEKMGVFVADNALPKAVEGRGDFLSQASLQAVACLSQNDQAFFLMIEGSQIDWGGHDNDADYLIGEMLDFDKTLGAVLEFAKNDGNTLVVVTADHETGGFTLGSDRGNYNSINPTFSTDGHSGTMIPVLAYGPGSENFGGIYENSEIFHKVMSLLK